MKRILAGMFVTVVATLASVSFASTAQAYPCPPVTSEGPTTNPTAGDGPVVGCHSVNPPESTPPTPEDDTPQTDTVSPTSSNDTPAGPTSTSNASGEAPESGLLPSTGGPESVLLIGGVALLAVGGAAVLVARRRQNH